jgi:hypothetical protein
MKNDKGKDIGALRHEKSARPFSFLIFHSTYPGNHLGLDSRPSGQRPVRTAVERSYMSRSDVCNSYRISGLDSPKKDLLSVDFC